MKITLILITFITSFGAYASTSMEKVLDVACKVLHANAFLSKHIEGTQKFQEVYTNNVTPAHTEWRSLWTKATNKEKQSYINLLQSLHEAQKIAFLFEKSKTTTPPLSQPSTHTVIQPSENMKKADIFLDTWKKASLSAPNNPMLATLENTVFNCKKNPPPKPTITLEKTTTTVINQSVKITHPVMLEFLNGYAPTYRNNSITGSVSWGSEQFAIKDGNTIVGYVGLSNNTITPMYIFPRYQGKSYGHYAALELIKMLKMRGVKHLRSIIDVLNLPSLLCRLGLGFTTDVNASNYGMQDYPALFPGFLYTLDLDAENFV